MAQQKSEDRVVPDGGVMPAQPDVVGSGQGKAVPVDQVAWQLQLPIATAEDPEGSARKAARDRSRAGRAGVPKAIVIEEKSAPARMEEVAERVDLAMKKVVANKGAPGPDGMTVDQLREQWPTVSQRLRAGLLSGSYRPGGIRRVMIPKLDGGQRALGIPNVVDRVVMEAVRQVLEPLFEPTFHESSHGFRPGRSCHTAVAEAKQHVRDGYEWVVDVDLEKFFDRVNHQRLIARLAQRVDDRRLLVLIARLLKARVVLSDGVVIGVDEGVPQGSPLSPLLSNIVLDELDAELARRGHRFTRYADDCNVYVRSERAGQRVMASLTAFIQWRLRLRINASKSAVARPADRHFLGFCLRVVHGRRRTVEVGLSQRTKRNAMARIRQLTPRTWGGTLESAIARINTWLRGWHQFFGIASAEEQQEMRRIDAHIRRRLRAILLHHWKRQRTIARRLIALGVAPQSAWRAVYAGKKSTWALSHAPAVDHGLRNAYFAKRGLTSVARLHRDRRPAISAHAHPTMALEQG
jgi:RNA-directed DNA polymerase